MKTFKALMEQMSSMDQHKKRVQKMAKGSSVSFTHSQTGNKVTGKYMGLKSRDGNSYAAVETDKGRFHVPVHHIH